jgi:hypothetical protein
MRKRLPEFQAILQVYAVIAVMLSGWTIIAFLRKLPSWLLTLNIGEIFNVFSYSMVVNLVESLIVLLLLLLASALLPARAFRDDFGARGAMLSIGFLGSLMVYLRMLMQFGMGNVITLLIPPLIILLLTAFLVGSSSKPRIVRFARSAALWISDRLVVFLFILIPLFVVLSVYVIFRNII